MTKQKQPPELFYGKGVIKGVIRGYQRPAILLKKRLWARCFLVNFSKIQRTPFLQKTSGRLLLKKSGQDFVNVSMKETCRRELFLVDTQMLKCSCVVERDRKKKKDSPITFLLALYLVNIWKIQPVYDGPSVAICPSACAFVAFFLYSLKRLSSSFFT